MAGDTPRVCVECGGEIVVMDRTVKAVIDEYEELFMGWLEIPTCSFCGNVRLDPTCFAGRFVSGRVAQKKTELGLPEDAQVRFLFEERGNE